MDLLNVVIRADTSGSDRASQSLDNMTASARQADAAIDSVGAASATAGRGLSQASVSTDRATASAKAHSAAVQAQVQANNSLIASYRGSSLAADQAAQAAARAAAANNNRASGSGSSFNTANIAAQFQDIGVTAAMGMNPLQIALQQGTQLSAVMATMERPLQGIAAGFAAVLSPLSLMTIGFVALLAAGLQFVDWGGVAEVTLNILADGLEVIAPYAVAAAAGLALLYSPALLSGLMAAVGSLGTLATAVWGVAAAIYATVGLPALLIAGFVAMAAAAVVWRDDLKDILGVDLVQVVQDAGNYIIGVFVGSYEAVVAQWSNLPTFFSAVGKKAWNNFVSSFEGPSLTIDTPWGSLIGPSYNLDGMKSQLTPEEEASFDTSSVSFGDALQRDYIGQGINLMKDGASGAADALRNLADSIGDSSKENKKAAREAERQAKAYADIVLGANQFIETQQREASSLGLTAEAAARLRYEQEMLNKAANDNIDLSASQKAEVSALAAAMAAAEETTRRITEVYNLGKEVFSGFFSEMKSGLKEGQSFWEALGNAGASALDKIADRALSMAADGLFDMIFGALMGGLGGGATGGIWGNGLWGSAIFNAKGNVYHSPSLAAYSNGVYNRPQMFAFAHGAGIFAEAGPEAIMPLARTSSGDLGVRVANQNQANDNRRGDVHFHINGSGLSKSDLAAAIADGLREYDSSLAPKVEAKFRTMQSDPRAADGSW